ncbi:MAG: glycoside hydrolase family 127 protein [Lachnospiraceae bacterium]|nr:glycoside hydrolase family 127 protein [Lachnospiraceae bacterium]
MEPAQFSTPLDLHNIQVKDGFWTRQQDLVTDKVLPYQWNALNDNLPDALPSYSMHNFRAAARIMEKKHRSQANATQSYTPPVYTYRGFEALPEDPAHPDPEQFYGFVFQDSDFSKWIEAVGYSLIRHPDPQLEKLADGAIDVVCAAQDDTGYLDTYYIVNGMDRAFTNLRDHHELYCLGHLLEGAISYYQATGKDKLLKAAERFADYCFTVFGENPDQKKGYPGHEIAEMALFRLYELTGEERYKKLASFFLDQRGTKPSYFRQEDYARAALDHTTYQPTEEKEHPTWFEATPYAYYQAHKPVREQTEAVGHAVRAVYLYSGMADAARINRDDKMLAACEALWNNITGEKLYITGGIGATHFGEAFSYGYDLPNDTAYSESCAAIGLIFFARRMLQIKPDRRYSDVMEQALYNTVMAGMDLTGTRFFYVNPLEANPLASLRDEHKHHVRTMRQKWFGCACCPPNIARLLSSLASYATTENENTLWNHLYVGSRIQKHLGSTDQNTHSGNDRENTSASHILVQEMTSALPWSGEVQVHLTGDGTKASASYRIPSWSRSTRITLQQGAESYELTLGAESSYSWPVSEDRLVFSYENGYFTVTGPIRDLTICLSFTLECRLVKASNRVREDAHKVCLVRGPLVYCLEEIDNGRDLHLLEIPLSQKGAAPVFTEEETSAFGYPVILVKTEGIRKKPDEIALYQDADAPEPAEETTLTFVPYYLWNNRGEGEMSVWIYKS